MFIFGYPGHKITPVLSDVPFVSIIIPARPEEADLPALQAARELEYPRERLEIFVVRGRQPAVQRNMALGKAQGDLVYFLDDDAIADPKNLTRSIRLFDDPSVAIVGGPNLCPRSAPFIEQVFAAVLGSWLAFGPSRARYSAIGPVRPTTEKELILCNLLARRARIIEAGGFDESLYPNEENALMDSVQKAGGILIYDPAFTAIRRPRRSLRGFFKMLFTYGRGRAEQLRRHPSKGSLLNLAPPVFCIYLAGLGILCCAGSVPAWLAAPLAVYLFAVMVQGVCLMPGHGFAVSFIATPLQCAVPLLYGVGFWCGMFTKPKAKKTVQEPILECIRTA